MKLCRQHFELCDESVRNHGLWPLIENKHEFNPQVALHSHLFCFAAHMLRENHTDCPLCAFKQKDDAFDALLAVEELVSDMARWAREQRLIPKLH